MTRASLHHTMNHRDVVLNLLRSSHQRCSVKKGVLKTFAIHRKTPVLECLFNKVAGLESCNFIKKILLHWCFPMKVAKFLRTAISNNICKWLLLFASPQNTLTNSGGEFGLDETSTECNGSIFLNVTILFDQMQPYNLYVSWNKFL